MSTADTAWAKLPAHYQTPHQQELFDAFKPSVEAAAAAAKGSASVASTLDDFAAGITTLQKQRDDLLAEVTERSAQHVPTEAAAAHTWLLDSADLQSRVNACAKQFAALVEDAASQLRNIADDGSLSTPHSTRSPGGARPRAWPRSGCSATPSSRT